MKADPDTMQVVQVKDSRELQKLMSAIVMIFVQVAPEKPPPTVTPLPPIEVTTAMLGSGPGTLIGYGKGGLFPLKILQGNTNGLTVVKKAHLQEIVRKQDPDVILLQECKASAAHAQNMELEGYAAVTQHRTSYGGGVAVQLKREHFENATEVLDAAKGQKEAEVLVVKLKKGSDEIFVGTVYIPPISSFVPGTFRKLLETGHCFMGGRSQPSKLLIEDTPDLPI